MGQEFSKPDPTSEEKEILLKVCDCIEKLPEDQSDANYSQIRAHDKLNSVHIAGYQLLLSCIHQIYGLGNDITVEGLSKWKEEERRLLNKSSLLNAYDLDTLWILYAATKDTKYCNRVKEVSIDTKQEFSTRGAANWSYNSHVEQGKVIEQ
jgi:hypothetical protein